MSEHINTSIVLKALAIALLHREPPLNLLFHLRNSSIERQGSKTGRDSCTGVAPPQTLNGTSLPNWPINSIPHFLQEFLESVVIAQIIPALIEDEPPQAKVLDLPRLSQQRECQVFVA